MTAAELYRVLVTVPDGITFYLRPDGRGATSDPAASWVGTLEEAEEYAAERDRLHGPSGYRYRVEQVEVTP